MSAEAILVIGGGISGITAAVEAAEAGHEVILIEKSPFLGGRVARMHLYFPKLCPPGCGLEINYKRIRSNPSITVLTGAEIESLSGSPGQYQVTVRLTPRFVTDACTACGQCTETCPAERFDEFNYGLKKTKAVYLQNVGAYPARYAIDRTVCPTGCRACVDACKYSAIDLDQTVESKTFNVAAVIAATGWRPYDAASIDNLGFGKCANVITNVMMERMAAPDGPTGGRILRPSDGTPPKMVAFVQCAGSRDENHLPYCSAVCCTASLKQAAYVRADCPDASIAIFYIDVRTGGRLEDFYARVAADEKITLIKGKVAKVEAAPDGDVLITAEDALNSKKHTTRVGLLVLATGIVPQTDGLPPGFALDNYRFIANPAGRTGLYAAGCVRRPEEVSAAVQDATGAALKAIQNVARATVHG